MRAPLRSRPAFTLLEILVTTGIIILLAALVLVALNPMKQLGFARNAQRLGDISSIISATQQYGMEQDFLPSTIPTGTGGSAQQICQFSYVPVDQWECVNLRILSGAYLSLMPIDPRLEGTGTGYTGYYISQEENTVLWGRAPYAATEMFGEVIEITR